MSDFAERLTILISHKDGLLSQLSEAKKDFENPDNRPPVCKKLRALDLVSKVNKKFPFPLDFEKLGVHPSLSDVKKSSSSLLEEVEESYWVFFNALEFRDEALRLLNDIAGSCTLNPVFNPTLSFGFMDLFVSLVQLIFLLSSYHSARDVLALHDLVYFFAHKRRDQSYKRVAQFMHDYSDPVRSLHEDLHSLFESVAGVLEPLYLDIALLSDHKSLRQEGKFSLSKDPQNITNAPKDYEIYRDAINYEKYIRWVLFGFLFCPQALENTSLISMLELALSQVFVIPIFQEYTVHPHEMYERIFKDPRYKQLGLKKQKSMVSNALNAAVTTTPKRRRKSRVFLIQALSESYGILQSSRGLIPVKLPVILGLLGLSKYEIFYFFSHRVGLGRYSKIAQKKTLEECYETDFEVTTVSSLIYHAKQLYDLVLDSRDIVSRYYSRELSEKWSKTAGELCSQRLETKANMDDLVKRLFYQNFVTDVSEIRGDVEQFYDFSTLKLNWFRIEATLSSRKITKMDCVINTLGGDFSKQMSLILRDLSSVDSLPAEMDFALGLHRLYPYIGFLTAIFVKGLSGLRGEQAYSSAYIDILGHFYKIVHPLNYSSLVDVGEEVRSSLEDFLDILGQRIAKLVLNIAGKSGFLWLRRQTYAVNVPRRRRKLLALEESGGSQLRERRRGGALPGEESLSKNKKGVEHLRKWQYSLYLLCRIASKYEKPIRLYDSLLSPREFVRTHLKSEITKYLQSIVSVQVLRKKKGVVDLGNDEVVDEKEAGKANTVTVVTRPSELRNEIQSLMYSMKLLENSLKLDTGEILTEVLLENCFFGKMGPQGQLTDYQNTKSPQESLLIAHYVKLFTSFIEEHITGDAIYSPKLKSFLNKEDPKNPMAYRADYYFSWRELVAFCEIFGPYGVRAVDNSIIALLMKSVASMNTILKENETNLKDFQNVYWKKNEAGSILKKISGTEELFQISIKIGAITQLRDLLYEALRHSVLNMAPLIYSTVQFAFSQYPNNVFGLQDFMDMDMLAQNYGVTMETAVDHPFRIGIKMFAKEEGVSDAWNLLPFLYASLFYGDHWEGTRYAPEMDACLDNAHLIAKCVYKTLVIPLLVKDIENVDDIEKSGELLTANVKMFVEVSSFILLNLGQSKEMAKKTLALNSMLTIIDKFVQDSPILTMDFLDELVPFILLRTTYGRLYTEDEKRNKQAPSSKSQRLLRMQTQINVEPPKM